MDDLIRWLVFRQPAISQKRKGFPPKTCWIRARVGLSLWQAGEWSSHWTLPCDSTKKRSGKGLPTNQQTNNQGTSQQPTLQAFHWKGDFFLPRSHQIYELPHKGYSGLKANVETTKAFFAEKKQRVWMTALDSTQEFILLDAVLDACDPILSFLLEGNESQR